MAKISHFLTSRAQVWRGVIFENENRTSKVWGVGSVYRRRRHDFCLDVGIPDVGFISGSASYLGCRLTSFAGFAGIIEYRGS